MRNQKNKLSGTKRLKTLGEGPLPSPGRQFQCLPGATSQPDTQWGQAWDALVEPVWLLDAEFRIQQCNQAAQKTFGSQIVGRHCWEVAHGAEEQSCGCPLPRLCQTGCRNSSEWRIGSQWYNCTVDPLFDSTGKVSGALLVLREISEDVRRRVEVAERFERERRLLRTMIDLLPDFIFVKDTQHRFLVVNEALAKAYAHLPSELLSRTDADFMAPEIAARCFESEEQVLTGKPFSASEDTIQFPDGKVRTMTTHLAAFGDTRGEISGLVGIGRDITNRKRMEEDLRKSEESLRQFVDNAPVAIAMLDRDMKYLAVSERWLQDYGLTGRDILGNSHYEIFPEIPDRWKAIHQRALAGEVIRQDEDRFERVDGSVHWLEWELRPWYSGGGTIGGLVIFTEEITERKRAEELVRESEEKFRQLFSTVSDAILVFDADTRKFVEVNEAALRLYGYTREELETASALDLSAEPALSDESIAATKLGRVNRIPIRYHKKKDGTVFPVEIYANTFILNGRTLYCGIVRDISERKQAEFVLKQAQRLAGVGNWEWDIATGGHFWSEEIYKIYGRDPALPPAVFPEVREYFTPESWSRLSEAVEKARTEGVAYQCDAEVIRADGSHRWVTARGQAVQNAAGEVVKLHGTVQDITERKRVEQLLRNVNRTLQAIRDCHEAMLRAGSERELLDDICRIIVQRGGERMAWVGFAQKNARKTVQPAAAAGIGLGDLRKARVTWSNTAHGRGPVGTAIRTGQLCLCRDTHADPSYASWKESARRHGFGSVIALPLMSEKRCFGALAIYAAKTDAFDANEQLLFTDLANDLAFGITTLRLRSERERLENEIFKSIEREQERIGRDLHDGLCQLLVGAKYRSAFLQKIAPAKVPEVAQEAKLLEEVLNQAIEQARDLARGLNPVKVTPAGLTVALQKLAEDVESAHRIHCFCQCPKPVKVADHHMAYHLYRIAQEAVQNAVKHAHAKNISITLTRPDRRLNLSIKDDGIGIAEERQPTGMGLGNMETRASLIGGRLEIRRRKHGGTAVSCTLP